MTNVGSNTTPHFFDTGLNANGVVYADTAGQLLNTTVGAVGQILTSNGPGNAPSFSAPGSSSISITGDTGTTLTGNSFIIHAGTSTQNAGSSISFSGSGTTLTLNVTDAQNNTVFGQGSGNAGLSGTSFSNTIFGQGAAPVLNGGNNNCGFGMQSLLLATSSNFCTAIGFGALNNLLTGSSCIGLGINAGSAYTSSESSNISISNVGVVGESHVTRIGTQGTGSGQQSTCFIAGITGVTTANSNFVTINTSTGQLGAVAGSASGAVISLTGNSGGVLTPSSGNFNTFGTGSITIVGSGSTLTTQLTGLTNHAVLVGAGTATITNIAATANTGAVLQNNSGADPSYSTATYPSTTTSQQILYSTANNVIGQLTTANSKFPATNATGTLAMRALSVVIQVFNASGTYTPTTGMLYAVIEAVGGGGAGGGAAITTAAQFSAGTGGASGEYAKGVFSASTVGASQVITIGAGGVGAAGTTGGTGGNTSVGALISANGGSGGPTIAASTGGNGYGGAGGTGGSGGSYRVNGSFGGVANFVVGSFAFSGLGSSGPFGSGGTGVTGANSVGGAGTGNGAGGGGALNLTSQAAAIVGGAGSLGKVVVTEYVIA
jgi:hypothetical protein